ncbi:unnamed protein product, partial [Amoebophrya sp. A25]
EKAPLSTFSTPPTATRLRLLAPGQISTSSRRGLRSRKQQKRRAYR